MRLGDAKARCILPACLIAFASMTFAPGATVPARADDATFVVATNFKAVIAELEKMFEANSEHDVTITTGSTGKLYAQIKNGAPFDAFLAADQRRPMLLEEEGDIVPGSRFTYAVGQIVLWSPDPERIGGDGVEVLKDGDFNFVAIANPELAPYGLAAQQVMQHYDLWEALSPKIVMGENIGQAFSMTATGNAELGFVALSSVLAPGNEQEGSWWDAPDEAHAPIRQDAVLLKRGADNEAAKAFLDFIRSDEAAEVIKSFGYAVE
jgi:molybdate transport system substrate-binding protein